MLWQQLNFVHANKAIELKLRERDRKRERERERERERQRESLGAAQMQV